MAIRKTCLLVLCLFKLSGLWAQEIKNPDYFIVHYTDENGLPQNSVKAIMKGRWDFIWLGTEDGLVRFDGQRFYTFNKSQIPISSNRIGGFIPFFKTYTLQNREFAAFEEQMKIIRIVAGGKVVVDTTLAKFSEENIPFLKHTNGKMEVMQSLPYRFPLAPDRGAFLIPDGKGDFYVWSPERVEFFVNKKRKFSAPGLFNEVFLIDSHPFATLPGGEFIDLRNGNPQREIPVQGDISGEELISNGKPAYRLFWNNVSQKAFLYLNKKFYSLKKTKNSGLQTKLILRDFDFDEFNITTSYMDEDQGYLFLGSYTDGLYVLRRKNFETKRSEVNGEDNVFYAQKPVGPNAILSSQGYIFDKTARRQNVYTAPIFVEEDARYYLAMNHDSSFWIGNSVILNKMDKMGKQKLLSYQLQEKFKALFVDRDEILWIGGLNNLLLALDSRNPKSVPQVISRASFGEISCMQRPPGDYLYLGTTKGLYKFNISSKQVTSIKGLEKANIRSIYYSDGQIWVTTYGDGLYHLKDNTLTRLPLDNNRFLATSHCIVEDKKGFFWITTNKGLFQVLKTDLLSYVNKKNQYVYYLYYDKRHGFGSNEFNGGCQPCGLALADHTISFPSMDGFVWFNPEKIKPELSDKPIYFDRIELEGNLIREKPEIEIPYDFKRLSISVVTPYFNNRNNLRIEYSFQSEGNAPVWLPVSQQFDIQIPNTSSGNHDLIFRKFNGFGLNNFSYKKLNIYIRPAWYETPTARFLATLLLILLFWIILKLRTGYLLKKERGKNLHKQYHISRQIVAAINHDIQTPLHYVSHSFTLIQNHLEKNNKADMYITRMSEETIHTINYARSHTSNLLNYIKSQNHNNPNNLKITEVNVRDIIEHAKNILSGTARHRDIVIVNEVAEDFIVKCEAQLFSVIVQNLMDNAVKLSHESVTISSQIDGDSKRLIFRDTADGMPVEILYWLNVKYKSYSNWLKNYEYPNHKGLGLVIVKDISVLLGLKIEAESFGKAGSQIILTFPEK